MDPAAMTVAARLTPQLPSRPAASPDREGLEHWLIDPIQQGPRPVVYPSATPDFAWPREYRWLTATQTPLEVWALISHFDPKQIDTSRGGGLRPRPVYASRNQIHAITAEIPGPISLRCSGLRDSSTSLRPPYALLSSSTHACATHLGGSTFYRSLRAGRRGGRGRRRPAGPRGARARRPRIPCTSPTQRRELRSIRA